MSTETQALTDALADWRQLPVRERWEWWDQLWHETIAVSDRYRLALRSGWWEDSVRVEALAAFAAWVASFDTGVSIDPPDKLRLLGQIEWLRTILRGGEHAFDPPTDRRTFDDHLESIGCQAPDGRQTPTAESDPRLERHRAGLTSELAVIDTRLREIDDRARALVAELDRSPKAAAGHAARDLSELKRTVTRLRNREQELHGQLEATASG